MQVTSHTDHFATAPQLAPAHMAAIAAQGFTTVINNRPDMEGGPEQPTSAQMESAALAAGLAYHYLPVVSGAITPEQVSQMAALVNAATGPVLAFCRSGARSTELWLLGQP
ncbi:MAG: TIGR01244 family phosphatase [Betaproteobacteria bacterium]|nr:TIGR01244 family phosphatase [Betaproteobacteria bacterium]